MMEKLQQSLHLPINANKLMQLIIKTGLSKVSSFSMHKNKGQQTWWQDHDVL